MGRMDRWRVNGGMDGEWMMSGWVGGWMDELVNG